MWSWDERLGCVDDQKKGNQSREYTSVILKDTSRRIMQNVHAVERLECFEVLIDIWNTTEVDTYWPCADYRCNRVPNLFSDYSRS
jgi:hypothetical protein